MNVCRQRYSKNISVKSSDIQMEGKVLDRVEDAAREIRERFATTINVVAENSTQNSTIKTPVAVLSVEEEIICQMSGVALLLYNVGRLDANIVTGKQIGRAHV